MGRVFRYEPNKKLEQITRVKLPFHMPEYDNAKVGGTGTENYGVGGLQVTFILKGEKGAVQFMCAFPSYLEMTHDWWEQKFGNRNGTSKYADGIRGYDVGYHAKVPQYENQSRMGECDLFPDLKGGCYYDGSSLRADSWTEEIFSTRNDLPENVLWKKLEEEYVERFGEP